LKLEFEPGSPAETTSQHLRWDTILNGFIASRPPTEKPTKSFDGSGVRFAPMKHRASVRSQHEAVLEYEKGSCLFGVRRRCFPAGLPCWGRASCGRVASIVLTSFSWLTSYWARRESNPHLSATGRTLLPLSHGPDDLPRCSLRERSLEKLAAPVRLVRSLISFPYCGSRARTGDLMVMSHARCLLRHPAFDPRHAPSRILSRAPSFLPVIARFSAALQGSVTSF
jgi:hypothetical protein